MILKRQEDGYWYYKKQRVPTNWFGKPDLDWVALQEWQRRVRTRMKITYWDSNGNMEKMGFHGFVRKGRTHWVLQISKDDRLISIHLYKGDARKVIHGLRLISKSKHHTFVKFELEFDRRIKIENSI